MKKFEFSKPFEHSVFNNFLCKSQLNKLTEIYQGLKFKDNKSDLYNFSQSQELNKMVEIQFFKKALDELFKEYYNDMENTYYNIFGSYYKKGDYLLCHDDLVENRILAFTYYLEDFESGKLLLYENDCVTENKKIDVTKNRLVIFKVGSTSFHEVSECTSDGRKALSGWLCSDFYKIPLPMKYTGFSLPKNIQWFDLGFSINEQDDLIVMETGDIKLIETIYSMTGPFNTRRFIDIQLETHFAFLIDNYELIYFKSIFFDFDSYILMNDEEVNKYRNVIDIFVCFKSDDGNKLCVSYSNDAGVISTQLELCPNNVFIRQRANQYMLILKQKSKFKFLHLIYRPVV